MTPYAPMLCYGPNLRPGIAVIACSMVLLTGCSTVVSYQSHLPAGPARPPGYPIPIYTEKMTVPRPCEVIGTVTVGEGSLTMRGGSVEEETKKIIKTAWEKGADVVQLRSIETPGFTRADFRVVADLARYSDVWENIPLSEQGLADYLDAHRQTLDPIEGIWDGAGTNPNRIGIIRDRFKPGRDFVGFILNTGNPAWHEGCKKMDIKRGVQPGSYILEYYLEDFSKVEVTVVLGRSQMFSLNMPTSDEEADFITYSRSP
jgi:hypothetical protein